MHAKLFIYECHQIYNYMAFRVIAWVMMCHINTSTWSMLQWLCAVSIFHKLWDYPFRATLCIRTVRKATNWNLKKYSSQQNMLHAAALLRILVVRAILRRDENRCIKINCRFRVSIATSAQIKIDRFHLTYL